MNSELRTQDSELAFRRGFTLMELLIAVLLMMILLSSITMIFQRTMESVAIAEARQQVYNNARNALDTMENDLMGCLPFSSGQNRFVLRNDEVGKPFMAIFPDDGIDSVAAGKAADSIRFRATITKADTQQTCEVVYRLIPTRYAIEDNGTYSDTANTEHSLTLRSKRPLYTLVRETWVADPAQTDPTQPWTALPKRTQGAVTETLTHDELCHYVVAMNIEYYASNRMFSQIASATNPAPQSDPLGNALGGNDDTAGGTAVRVPAIRVTLTIVDGEAERQERIVPKVIWIPMG